MVATLRCMASTTCPFCRAFTNLTVVQKKPVSPNTQLAYGLPPNVLTEECAVQCQACQRYFVAFILGDQVRAQEPVSAAGKDFPDVPARIASLASEAHSCLSINAARGAVALARAVIEAVAKDKGISANGIQSKIDGMVTAGLIRKNVADAAHQIRWDGNEVAHGDIDTDPITPDEAEDTLGLMDVVLTEVYQTAAQVARVAANRQARKASVGAPPPGP